MMLGDYTNLPQKGLEIGVLSEGGERSTQLLRAQEQRCTAVTVKGCDANV